MWQWCSLTITHVYFFTFLPSALCILVVHLLLITRFHYLPESIAIVFLGGLIGKVKRGVILDIKIFSILWLGLSRSQILNHYLFTYSQVRCYLYFQRTTVGKRKKLFLQQLFSCLSFRQLSLKVDTICIKETFSKIWGLSWSSLYSELFSLLLSSVSNWHGWCVWWWKWVYNVL